VEVCSQQGKSLISFRKNFRRRSDAKKGKSSHSGRGYNLCPGKGEGTFLLILGKSKKGLLYFSQRGIGSKPKEVNPGVGGGTLFVTDRRLYGAPEWGKKRWQGAPEEGEVLHTKKKMFAME